MTLASGYNALGLYLEHRFAYPSASWAAGKGSLTPENVRKLVEEFPNLQIIPFANFLGHMEGFLYTAEGAKYAEATFRGMQACPSKPEVSVLCRRLLDDIVNVFPSNIIHIGADEIEQLGSCPACKERIKIFEEQNPGGDGKAMLFGTHFEMLAKRVLEAGKTPAVWGDMFTAHPAALDYFPKETIIFEWQYFSNPIKTAQPFLDKGYRVVNCPTLITYAAPWLHLPQAELNVTEHAQATEEIQALGVCVTTWEGGLFANFETMLPAIQGCGAILSNPPKRLGDWATEEDYFAHTQAPNLLAAYESHSESYGQWARLMGVELQECGGLFAYGTIRSALKARFLLYSNPFLLWLRNREEFLGDGATKALQVMDHAISVSPTPGARGCAEFIRITIEFVRHVEESAQAYARHCPGESVAALAPARACFDDLSKIAKASLLNSGGSMADIERCKSAKSHVERVMSRIKQYGDGSLGYLPSYETICHPKFIPHDQGNWWLMNDWANE
jgi:hypothetical protein